MPHKKIPLFSLIWSFYLALVLVACGGTSPTVPPTSANQINRPTVPAKLDISKLTLGDGKVSTTTPQKGLILVCRIVTGGGGAFRTGEWIQETTWDLTKKITVSGEVSWSNAKIEITLEGANRKIAGNALPKHPTGVFPIARTDKAFEYDRNPNSIREQNLNYTLAANPGEASRPGCVSLGTIGVALSGVAIFNGLDAENRDAVAHELQDKCGGHPERNGTYHYHGHSSCFTGSNEGLVGYILDGFGIFNYMENGKEITNADLDECHGHKHRLNWDGKPTEIYHYHLTREYPYTIGCYKGTVNLRPPRP
jgi:hypothetical protein